MKLLSEFLKETVLDTKDLAIDVLAKDFESLFRPIAKSNNWSKPKNDSGLITTEIETRENWQRPDGGDVDWSIDSQRNEAQELWSEIEEIFKKKLKRKYKSATGQGIPVYYTEIHPRLGAGRKDDYGIILGDKLAIWYHSDLYTGWTQRINDDEAKDILKIIYNSNNNPDFPSGRKVKKVLFNLPDGSAEALAGVFGLLI